MLSMGDNCVFSRQTGRGAIELGVSRPVSLQQFERRQLSPTSREKLRSRLESVGRADGRTEGRTLFPTGGFVRWSSHGDGFGTTKK